MILNIECILWRLRMKNYLNTITKRLLDFMFYGGILVTLTVGFIIHFYGKMNPYYKEYQLELTIVFVISGILALLIIQELRAMMKSVLLDDCFVTANVVSLRKMGNYSFFIAIVTAARFFIYLTPAVLVIMLVFLVAGLFSKVLSQVFDKAVLYKHENDMTI